MADDLQPREEGFEIPSLSCTVLMCAACCIKGCDGFSFGCKTPECCSGICCGDSQWCKTIECCKGTCSGDSSSCQTPECCRGTCCGDSEGCKTPNWCSGLCSVFSSFHPEHALEKSPEDREREAYCDICGDSGSYYFCIDCNWDVCNYCFNEEKSCLKRPSFFLDVYHSAHEHKLEVVPAEYSEYRMCDICAKSPTVYFCPECDWDTCWECLEKDRSCLASCSISCLTITSIHHGHPLKAVPQKVAKYRTCDVCEMTTTLYFCEYCDWDICQICYTKEKTPDCLKPVSSLCGSNIAKTYDPLQAVNVESKCCDSMSADKTVKSASIREGKWRCFFVCFPREKIFAAQQSSRSDHERHELTEWSSIFEDIEYYIGFVWTNRDEDLDKLHGTFDVHANPNPSADIVEFDVDAQKFFDREVSKEQVRVLLDQKQKNEKVDFFDLKGGRSSVLDYDESSVLCFVINSKQQFLDFVKYECEDLRYYARIQSLTTVNILGDPQVSLQLSFDPKANNIRQPIKIFDPKDIVKLISGFKIKKDSEEDRYNKERHFFKHEDECYVDIDDDVLLSIPAAALSELVDVDKSFAPLGFKCYKGYVMDIIKNTRYLVKIQADTTNARDKQDLSDTRSDFNYVVESGGVSPDRVNRQAPNESSGDYGSYRFGDIETETVRTVNKKSKDHKPGVLSTKTEVCLEHHILDKRQSANVKDKKQRTIKFICRVHSFQIKSRRSNQNDGRRSALNPGSRYRTSALVDSTGTVPSDECLLKLSVVYCSEEIKDSRLTFDPAVFKASKDAGNNLMLAKFLHPEKTGSTDRVLWYTENQRLTYTENIIQQPASLQRIIFKPNYEVRFLIECDNGNTFPGGVPISSIEIRPDLVHNTFDEKLVFPNNLKSLEITYKEYNGMISQKAEHWISLPKSIFGAAVCFLIVNHENYRDICEKQLCLSDQHSEEYLELENDRRNISVVFWTRCFMLFVEIFGTFLVQGVLIWSVYNQTPPQFGDESGLCTEHSYLQIAAIATLTLWTISAYTDTWTEIRCYLSRTYIHDIIDSEKFYMRKIDNRSWGYHVAFVLILSFEACITTVLFIAGVNFVLVQYKASDIVISILGISFITDIDNKVYEITLIPEDDDANVEVCKFRTTPLDVYDAIMGYKEASSLKKSDPDSNKRHSKGIQDSLSMYLNFLQWPIHIAVVVAIVLGMRFVYCE